MLPLGLEPAVSQPVTLAAGEAAGEAAAGEAAECHV